MADLGCGEGKLLRALRPRALARPPDRRRGLAAGARTRRPSASSSTDAGGPARRAGRRCSTARSTYRDERWAGFDAAALVEVIEHLDPERLPALERRRVRRGAPGAVVIVTTPNREYNALFPDLAAGALRHPDHRFEWTPRRVRGLGAERSGSATATALRFSGIGTVTIRSSGARPRWRSSAMNGSDPTHRHPRFCAGRPDRRVRLGQVDLRRAPFPADRGDLVGPLPRLVSRRRERPVASRADAFDLVRAIAEKRLKNRRLTVIDATNVRAPNAQGPGSSSPASGMRLPVAIVFDPRQRRLRRAQQPRPDRQFGGQVSPQRMIAEIRRGMRGLQREGLPLGHGGCRSRSIDAATRRPHSRCGPTSATRPAPSTSSATSMAAPTSWKRCSSELGYHGRMDGTGDAGDRVAGRPPS